MDLQRLAPGEDARALSREGVERWLPALGLPDYWISNLGRFASQKKERLRESRAAPRILKGSVVNTGYVMFTVFGEGKDRGPGKARRTSETAHRMVVRAFDGEAPTIDHTDVRHLNGQKQDNRLHNLAWGTRSENMRDVYDHRGGVPDAPERSEQQQKDAYYMDERLIRVGLEFHAEKKLTKADLARLWNVSDVTVNGIVTGRTWDHIDRPVAIPRKTRRTPSEMLQLRQWAREGLNAEEINKRLPPGADLLTPQDVNYLRTSIHKGIKT